MPHIMLLVDDPERMLIEQIGASIYSSQVMPLYTTQLMLNSGSISGWSIPADCSAHMEKALEKLYSANTDADGSVFMFAVGDGNHSLATAKAGCIQAGARRYATGKQLHFAPSRSWK